MKFVYYLLVFSFFFYNLTAYEVIVKKDNGVAKGINYSNSRIQWEESVLLQPDGPCKVNKIQIYYSGSQPAKDTLWICGFPTAGNLYPTEYIWSYNSLIPPIIVDYDGSPGWKEYDIKEKGLRSDGFDKIVIQHKFKAYGPHFTYDSDALQGLSWITDPFTPNANFYNIQGTIHYLSQGDYLVRLVVEYDYPQDSTSLEPPVTKLYPTNLISGGGYPSIVDWNNDGYDDIVLGGTLFENDKKGGFINKSSEFQLDASGTTWGDFNNDGKIDCYAIANGSPDWDKRMEWNRNKMYINDGNKLTPINQKSIFKTPYPNIKKLFETSTNYNNDSLHNPFNAISPIFFDYNNDGNLDLFIANRRTEVSGKLEIYAPDELWENNGDGTFKNVTDVSGVRYAEMYTPYNGSTGFGYYDCYGAMAQDFNKDNLMDIFVANYRLIKDNLLMNNGNSTFSEVAAEAGVQGLPTAAPQYFGHGMGCQWGDFNNDGNPDLIVGNLAHTDIRGIYSNPSLIFKNSGSPDYTFEAVHTKMGLKFHEGNAGAMWLDLDLDGLMDLWHGKYSGGIGSIYFNQGPPDYKLIEKTWQLNWVVQNPWTAVKLDYDNDGDFDIVCNGKLYRNDLVHKGKYLGIRLIGSPKDKVSMDAYGTKVTVYAGGKLFYQELAGSSAGSLCTQNSNEMLFGLGNVNEIDSTVIIFSNGIKRILKNLKPNAKYYINYLGEINSQIFTAPALIFPENNQILNENLNEINFKWDNVEGANSYTIEIYSNNQLITKKDVNTLNYLFSYSFAKGNIYEWKVIANGKESTTWKFSIGKPIPANIELVEPPNKSQNINVNYNFKWKSPNFDILIANENIEYQITIENEKREIIYSKLIQNQSQVKIDSILKPNSIYYWKVCANLINGQSKCSNYYEFKTMSLPKSLKLSEPPKDTIDYTTKPFFKWEADSISKLYHIQVSENNDMSAPVLDKSDISSNSYKLFKALNGQTKHYWRVRGINDGGFGEWSDIWSFTTGGVSSVYTQNDNEILIEIKEIIPNPAIDKINIKLSSQINDIITLSIINNLGIPIENKNINLNIGNNIIELGLNKYSSGVYFIKIEKQNLSAIKPFLLIH